MKCHSKFLAGEEFISSANAFHTDKPALSSREKGPPSNSTVNTVFSEVDFMWPTLLLIHSYAYLSMPTGLLTP